MTVYARSDVMSVSLSKDHGGCGATHSRPVTHGAPDKVWALDCHACENHLRQDPHWSVTSMEVPETPDETKVREDAEKKGEHTQKANLENAVASLAATADGFQKLMAMMFASNPDMAQNMTRMLNAMNALPDAEGVATLDTAAETPAVDLTKLKVAELRELAKSRGVNTAGTRDELIARLRG